MTIPSQRRTCRASGPLLRQPSYQNSALSHMNSVLHVTGDVPTCTQSHCLWHSIEYSPVLCVAVTLDLLEAQDRCQILLWPQVCHYAATQAASGWKDEKRRVYEDTLGTIKVTPSLRSETFDASNRKNSKYAQDWREAQGALASRKPSNL